MEIARNPLLPPDVCIPDGEAHVFGDRLYVYGSCDQEDNAYCSRSYYVVSTDDMQRWTVHDLAFSGTQIPWATKEGKHYPVVDMSPRNPTPVFRYMMEQMKLPTGRIPKFLLPRRIRVGRYLGDQMQYLFAPDCAYSNGKYYLYFCTGGYQEGVAVSDKPEGPFRDPVQLPIGGIDPAVFIDDDGAAYYYWGQFRASAAKLNADMVSLDLPKAVHGIVTEEEHGFHEGSSLRKRNGSYYFVYPCIFRGGKPTALAYATADSPLGPFTYRGVIVDNAKCDPESWNIHGSIECFHGQWYVFYHRSSGNGRTHRRLCAEPIFFNPDGTIDEVKMTSIGPGRPFCPGEIIEAWRACEVEGGAYVDGDRLVMKPGSKAIFRYAQLSDAHTPVCVEPCADVIAQWSRGAEAGLYELTLTSREDTTLRSILIQSRGDYNG